MKSPFIVTESGTKQAVLLVKAGQVGRLVPWGWGPSGQCKDLVPGEGDSSVQVGSSDDKCDLHHSLFVFS